MTVAPFPPGARRRGLDVQSSARFTAEQRPPAGPFCRRVLRAELAHRIPSVPSFHCRRNFSPRLCGPGFLARGQVGDSPGPGVKFLKTEASITNW
jgi:hypothetical protein